MRAVDEPISLMTKVCRLSVIERGDPLWYSLTQIPNVRENPRHSSENEQIRILLERQREQILAADYDMRSTQKLNEVIESQKEEIYRAHQGDEQLRRDQQLLHEQLLEQNRELREAHEKSLDEMEELKRFQG